MPEWMGSMLAATPALLWMFIGVGLPYALVALPRRDWRDRVVVACLTLAFGPAIVTAWMFALGSIQGEARLLRLDTVLVGTAVIAVIGWGLVLRRQGFKTPGYENNSKPTEGASSPLAPPFQPMRVDEKLLIGLIAIALVIRWLGVAYWPFTAYDALWVYGYEGKLYTLLDHIPTTIAYYPQFLPLQFTYLQLAVGGIDDHAARAVLPWLHLGSILAAYTLGRLLIGRRAGIYTAAIWALYPHVGAWSRFGDLEIPVTFLFTSAGAFFLKAWETPPPNPLPINGEGEYGHRRRYAGIAGVLLGIGMWTKPTMGAFIWGVLLVVGAELARQWWIGRSGEFALTPRHSLHEGEGGEKARPIIPGAGWVTATFQKTWPRLEVAVIAGLASLPLGAVWYIRNVALGHPAFELPPEFWPTLAARSGAELGWPLLALVVVAAWIIIQNQPPRRSQRDFLLFEGFARSQVRQENAFEKKPVTSLRMRSLTLGLVLVAAGVVPSIVQPHRMGLLEWLAATAGAGLAGWTLWTYSRGRWTDEARRTAGMIVWGLALALPYFMTWFYSYSYHYRLSFAIVPLMILPTAVIVEKIYPRNEPELQQPTGVKTQTAKTSNGKVIYLLAVMALSLPGMVAPLDDPNAGWDWLWTDKLADDHAKYTSGNTALMAVVDGLQTYLHEHDEPLRVVAPGIKRLPFFFPLEDIRIEEMPTRLDDLDGVTYFIYGTPEAGGDFDTIPAGVNQVLNALALATDDPNDTRAIMRQAWGYDDGIFKYTVYELRLENRWVKPQVGAPAEADVVFGGFAGYLGFDIGGLELWPGRRVVMHLYWEVLEQPDADYTVFIHLRDRQDNLWATWDGPVTRTEDGNYYSTLVWEAGEYISDERHIGLDSIEMPVGDGYRIVIGLYDQANETRAPVTVNGEPAGDSYTISERITIQAQAP